MRAHPKIVLEDETLCQNFLVCALIISMLAAGAFGGFVNFLVSKTKPNSTPNDVGSTVEGQLKWWQHILIGVAAAFIVPVFLNMISSGLIKEVSEEVSVAKAAPKLLILVGFCLVAAISSRAFIRNVTDKLLREVENTKRVAAEANSQAKEANKEAKKAT